MKKPNWKEWKFTPEVRVWEACALSLDIDPHSIVLSRHGWMAGPGYGPFFEDESFPDGATKDEFALRVRVLLANLRNRAYFSPRAQDAVTPGNSLVSLAEFSKWAVSVVQWGALPHELVALVQRPDLPVDVPAPTPIPAPELADVKAVSDADSIKTRDRKMLERLAELQGSGHKSPTTTTAKEFDVSDRLLRMKAEQAKKKKAALNAPTLGNQLKAIHKPTGK